MQDTIDFSRTSALGFYEHLGLAVEYGELEWNDREAVRDARVTHPKTVSPEKQEKKETTTNSPKPKAALTRCCAPFQRKECQINRDHNPLMHACAYCFKTVAGVFRHAEADCARKTADEAKNGARRE